MFCTHEDHHNPSRSVNAQLPAPIDFPSSCEIKLNGFPVPFSKGIKKQAGTAPPVDLSTVDRGADKSKALSLAPGTLNKVEVVYVNTEKVSFRFHFFATQKHTLISLHLFRNTSSSFI